MSGQQKHVTLSTYFKSNVQLVTKMCPRSDEGCIKAKISAIDFSFLKLTENFKVSKVKTLHPTKHDFCGFTEDEILKSWKYNITIEQIYCTVVESYKKMDYNNNKSFLRFSGEEMSESMECHKKFEEIDKLFRKPCLKSLKSTCGRRNNHSVREDHRKAIKTQRTIDKASKYLKTKVENHSKYFSKATESPKHKIKIGSKKELETKHFKPEPKDHKKPIRKQGAIDKAFKCSKAKIENQSKYFSEAEGDLKPKIKIDSNKELETKHFKPEPKDHKVYSRYFLQPNTPIEVKIEEEHEPKYKPVKEELESFDLETIYFKTEPIWRGKTEDSKDFAPHEKPARWVPPKSPHDLVEELLYDNPWALLVATIFLNRTKDLYARPHVFWFLKENPNPQKVLEKQPEDLEKYFGNLGLQRSRAVQVWRMSHDFVHKDWKNVKELYGIGKYGDDAYRMFCLGDFTVNPTDRYLRIYKAWYEKVAMRQNGDEILEGCIAGGK